MKAEPGPAMTLGNAAAAHVRLIVWCLDCRDQIEPDPAEMVRALRRRHAGAGVARAAGVRLLRVEARRYGGERDRARLNHLRWHHADALLKRTETACRACQYAECASATSGDVTMFKSSLFLAAPAEKL